MAVVHSPQKSHYLVDDPARGIFRVARRSFVDPAVLASERQFIFDRCWLYLGHASEIAKPGDFLARNVGGRELLFVRGKDAVVRAFFNTCPHRGALVCREKQGNGAMFRCFYHSWAFNLEGKLVNRPGDESYTAASRADAKNDLVPVPQLAQYRGLYFVHFQPASESLTDYLAGAAEIIDLVMDQAESGMEIVGGTQEYSIEANWKLLCENSFDGYHAGGRFACWGRASTSFSRRRTRSCSRAFPRAARSFRSIRSIVRRTDNPSPSAIASWRA